MDQGMIEILVLAFIAGFVLFRLYTTLGKRTGEERHEPAPAQGEFPRGPIPTPAPPQASVGPAGEGLPRKGRGEDERPTRAIVPGARERGVLDE